MLIIKCIVTEIKNFFDGLKTKLDIVKREKIGELKDTSVEITQTEIQIKKQKVEERIQN